MSHPPGKKDMGRKPNVLETRIHKSALQAGRPLTQKEVDAIAPDPTARTNALNFLSSAGLLKAQQDAAVGLLWRAVTKQEFEIKQNLTDEENMVLNHIQAASTQGIWTKHLKSKTELHQTVIDRCLKSLTHKQLIKAVKSVKYPTRKIFMLANLEPSIELTGGPWYTDNELDTEFIKLLCSACLRFIRDRTFPKPKSDAPPAAQPLFAPSSRPRYPYAQQVLSFLSRSKITETQFSEEHVEMLLNVLVLDGDIERLPASGGAILANDDSGDESSIDESDATSRKSRKRRKPSSLKRSKKRRRGGSDVDMSDDTEGSEYSDKSRRKRSHGKKRKRMRSSDEGGSDASASQYKKKKKRRMEESSDEDEESHDENDVRARRRRRRHSKSKPSSKRFMSSESGSNTNTDTDTGSDSDDRRTRRSRPRASSARMRKRPSSPTADDPSSASGAVVYRAVRQERVALGWAQAPCGACPQFDFCARAGPVNPSGCEYYAEWLPKAIAALE